MQIHKSQIIAMLRSTGEDGKADQVSEELPDNIDTDQHADKLARLGIDPHDLHGRDPGDQLATSPQELLDGGDLGDTLGG